MYVSRAIQEIALDVVTQSAWRTHLRGLRTQLRERRDLLVTSLHEHAPELQMDGTPTGGLNLWAQLPEGIDTQLFVRDCEDRGVLVAPGDEWFPTEPPGSYVRLNYSGPRPQDFPEAARLIGETVASHMTR